MGFEIVSWLKNIVYIWSHLSEKDKVITKKKGEYNTIQY
jgi:hypothetical protein